jgi:hypothetical protein
MIRFRLTGFAFAIATFSISIWSMNLSAALIIYEGFDYAVGTNVRTQTGGSGWSGAWTDTANANATETATSPGLTYGSLEVLGNKLTSTGQQNNASANGTSAFLLRDTAQSFGTDGTSVWLSFISQRTGSKSNGGTAQPLNYQRVFSLSLFTGTTEQASVGELSNDPADVWALNSDLTTFAPSAHTTTPLDTQSFLLVRLDFIAGVSTDKAYLWVNPDLSLGEPALGTEAATITDELSFNRIRLTVGGSQNTGATATASGLFDEIRVGDTFADVTPVPEPSSLCSALLCLAVSNIVRRCPRKLRR